MPIFAANFGYPITRSGNISLEGILSVEKYTW
jgi:hypothetical protein